MQVGYHQYMTRVKFKVIEVKVILAVVSITLWIKHPHKPVTLNYCMQIGHAYKITPTDSEVSQGHGDIG